MYSDITEFTGEPIVHLPLQNPKAHTRSRLHSMNRSLFIVIHYSTFQDNLKNLILIRLVWSKGHKCSELSELTTEMWGKDLKMLKSFSTTGIYHPTFEVSTRKVLRATALTLGLRILPHKVTEKLELQHRSSENKKLLCKTSKLINKVLY